MENGRLEIKYKIDQRQNFALDKELELVASIYGKFERIGSGYDSTTGERWKR